MHLLLHGSTHKKSIYCILKLALKNRIACSHMKKIPLLFSLIFMMAKSFAASTTPRQINDPNLNPTTWEENQLPQNISSQFTRRVLFWEKVFTWWDENELIIHNRKYPWIIYRVIEKQKYINKGLAKSTRDSFFDTLVTNTINEYQDKLLWLHDNPKMPLNPTMAALKEKFKHIYAPKLFLLSAERNNFRVQMGMRNYARKAFEKAGKYIARMERVFKKYGLPTQLTRVPFIESMFQEKATSFVGARGIWQLMPLTAKELGLVVTPEFDERLDFMSATIAAAKFFNQQHKQFGQWPLSVTSYNHGPGGVQKGIKATGSKNLQVLIDNFQDPNFGFASQNFYAELLAILNIEQKVDLLWNDLVPHKPEEFKSVHIKQPVLLDDLLNTYKIKDISTFKKLNPAIEANFEDPYLTLPKNLLVHVPKWEANKNPAVVLTKQ